MPTAEHASSKSLSRACVCVCVCVCVCACVHSIHLIRRLSVTHYTLLSVLKLEQGFGGFEYVCRRTQQQTMIHEKAREDPAGYSSMDTQSLDPTRIAHFSHHNLIGAFRVLTQA